MLNGKETKADNRESMLYECSVTSQADEGLFFHVDAKKIPCICVMFPDAICPSVLLLNGKENKADTVKYQ